MSILRVLLAHLPQEAEGGHIHTHTITHTGLPITHRLLAYVVKLQKYSVNRLTLATRKQHKSLIRRTSVRSKSLCSHSHSEIYTHHFLWGDLDQKSVSGSFEVMRSTKFSVSRRGKVQARRQTDRQTDPIIITACH